MLSDNLAEAGTMFAYATCPPDPAVVGERWRDMWHERLDAARPWVLEWLRHQHRDDYWRHASLSENYRALRCPVLPSSSWADGYSNAVYTPPQPCRRTAQGSDRPLIAQASSPRRTRTRHRVPPGGRPLVGPLAQGCRQRRHGRPHDPCLDAGERAPVHALPGAPGPMGGGAGLALAAHPRGDTPSARPRDRARGRGTPVIRGGRTRRARPHDSVAPVRRSVRRQVGLVQRPAGSAVRPAGGGRRTTGLRHPAADGAPGDPRRPRSGPARVVVRPRGPDHRPAVRRRARRPCDPGDLRRAQSRPPIR